MKHTPGKKVFIKHLRLHRCYPLYKRWCIKHLFYIHLQYLSTVFQNVVFSRHASAMCSGGVAYAKPDSMEPQRNRGRTNSEPRNVATRNEVKGDAQSHKIKKTPSLVNSTIGQLQHIRRLQ